MRTAAAELFVDHEAIASNTRWFVDHVEGDVMAVVKDDAFGHGDVLRTVLDAGASWLGLATLPEALAVREATAATGTPVLCWVTTPDDDVDAAVRSDIDLAVSDERQLHAIAAAGRRAGVAARVHLFIDVGMSRDGADASHWAPLCEMARHHERAGAVDVVGVMGHFSSADEPGAERTAVEELRYRNALRAARRRGLRPTALHLSATAGTVTGASAGTGCSLARIGAGLFGIDPSGTTDELRPAMTLTTTVAFTRSVGAGTGVGYGHDHVTDRATTLATLPLGYADGLPRTAGGRAEVQIRGRRHPVVGRFSMDMVVVDVGREGIAPGEPVTVFGPGDSGEPTVAEWAAWAATIPHDIVTSVGSRVSRVARIPVPVEAAEPTASCASAPTPAPRRVLA
ncbi:alanine racemase [Frigoribacterium salinisoli]